MQQEQGQEPLFDTGTLPVKQPEPCPRCGSQARIRGACTSCGYGILVQAAKPMKNRKRQGRRS